MKKALEEKIEIWSKPPFDEASILALNELKKYPDQEPIFYLRRDRETVKLNSKETYKYLNSVQVNE